MEYKLCPARICPIEDKRSQCGVDNEVLLSSSNSKQLINVRRQHINYETMQKRSKGERKGWQTSIMVVAPFNSQLETCLTYAWIERQMEGKIQEYTIQNKCWNLVLNKAYILLWSVFGASCDRRLSSIPLSVRITCYVYSSIVVLGILWYLDGLHMKPIAQHKCVTGSSAKRNAYKIQSLGRIFIECSCLEVGALDDHSEQKGK